MIRIVWLVTSPGVGHLVQQFVDQGGTVMTMARKLSQDGTGNKD